MGPCLGTLVKHARFKHPREPSPDDKDDDSAKESWEIRCLLGVAISVAVLCGLIQAHGLAKLVAAFVCQDSVWNFPNKCVQVH